MVIRSMATELCCPRYGDRGMLPEVLNLGLADCRYRGIVPRKNRANEYGSGTFFSLQGLERIALPRMDLVRQSGLPRRRRDGVQKSELPSPPPSAAGSETAKS